jgi:hypothetical protein
MDHTETVVRLTCSRSRTVDVYYPGVDEADLIDEVVLHRNAATEFQEKGWRWNAGRVLCPACVAALGLD